MARRLLTLSRLYAALQLGVRWEGGNRHGRKSHAGAVHGSGQHEWWRAQTTAADRQLPPLHARAGRPARVAAEVIRFGFAPDDFTLDVERLPGKRSAHSTAPTFSVRVSNIQNRRALTYLGGPCRAWVAEFLEDLIAGVFGQPQTPEPPLGRV